MSSQLGNREQNKAFACLDGAWTFSTELTMGGVHCCCGMFNRKRARDPSICRVFTALIGQRQATPSLRRSWDMDSAPGLSPAPDPTDFP
jgi:hypothetical protein